MSHASKVGGPRGMRASFMVCAVLVGCSAASGVDAGADSGVSVISDAGVGSGCFGVPERLALTSCDSQLLLGCPATADELRAQRDGVCQPAVYGGGIATLSCGGFETVAYTTRAISEAEAMTVECFYEPLGGALSGVLRFAGSSVSGFGTVADCNRTAPVLCDERCFDIPPYAYSVSCRGYEPAVCDSSAAAMRTANSGICQPGQNGGGISSAMCAGFEVVSVERPFTTVQCFFEPDGGALAGVLNFGDTGTGAWGRLADCGYPQLDCRELCGPFPSNVTAATCVDESRFANCGADFASVNIPVTVDCGAAQGVLGHAAEASCGNVNAVRWTYAQTGDTRECFFAADGGAFVGGLDFTDRGVFGNGTTASCTWSPVASCRDGGM